ncbi:olfactory receptor 11L1 [Xenopus laevis]|uniref:Olfactory receptor n=2 Tax=Xenopus laevis TaxID=8355 RepID=A0A1L8H418_XENLA|nr:olfactory receptor 11L1 [Xenopus laevis]OCT90843.1 hypothetical protein XELAEV_18019460mg [Xenopus laevis]
MTINNQTEITNILLLGFQNLHNLRSLLFIAILIIYIISITGNIVIISLISTHRQLHTPMYTFLGLLSSSEIISTTNIVPNMLVVIAADGSMLPFTACLSQFYIFSALTNTECFLLTVMSYDRYLAICHPLRYNSIMNFKLCLHLIIWSWVLGFIITLIILVNLVSTVKFCGPNTMNHFFCDLAPILNLSCSDTFIVEIQALLFSVPVIIMPFIFIIATYIFIAFTIMRITSTTGRKKTFSTCSSHLSTVCTYYGTLISVYLVPSKENSPNVKVVSLLYVIVTPLLNPIVYSFRNQDIRTALTKCIHKS